MTIIAIILLLIWLLVGWYLGRSYYSGTTKILSWIFVVLVSFVAAWLALRYSSADLWNIKPSSALWTGFIMSCIIAFISLLNGGTSWPIATASAWAASAGSVRVTSTKKSKKSTTKTYTGKPDNLKKIEWIGPVIEQHLNEEWKIFTFEQLADTEVVHLRSILDTQWDRFQNHNPDTRPAQAAMARDWDWKKLEKRQEGLDGGRVK